MNANQVKEQFKELLDECYPIEIGGMAYLASRVLERVDPIAYRECLLNYADSLLSDGEIDESVFDEL